MQHSRPHWAVQTPKAGQWASPDEEEGDTAQGQEAWDPGSHGQVDRSQARCERPEHTQAGQERAWAWRWGWQPCWNRIRGLVCTQLFLMQERWHHAALWGSQLQALTQETLMPQVGHVAINEWASRVELMASYKGNKAMATALEFCALLRKPQEHLLGQRGGPAPHWAFPGCVARSTVHASPPRGLISGWEEGRPLQEPPAHPWQGWLSQFCDPRMRFPLT